MNSTLIDLDVGDRPGYISVGLKTLAIVAFISWLAWVIRWRLESIRLVGSLPAPKFNWWIGNVIAYISIMPHCPPDGHPASTSTVVWRKFKLGGIFWLDTYPVTNYRQLVIVDVDVANQVTVTNNTTRHSAVKKVIGHILGSRSMLFQDNESWKFSRTLFNPGFAPSHLLTLVPGIVDDTMTFRELLSKHAASGEILLSERAAASLTIDIIGRVVLDHNFKSQTTRNEFVSAFRSQTAWSPAGANVEFWKNLNPIMPFAHWWYARKMDSYLSKVLDDRYAHRSTLADDNTRKVRAKPIVDLALDQYIAEQKAQGVKAAKGTDPVFKQTAMDQLKTFLFAGHDTTSSTITYIYYLLHLHPEKLVKLREEFDEVLGRDVEATPDLIRNDPNVVNKLVYANAIIKEVLRLFPPATAARQGGPTVHFEGQSIDTTDMMVWVNTHTIHRREKYFPSPDEFIPERFLPAPRNWQEVPKDAWRPFEKGPRSCIGQEFAMLEMKIIMALTLRDFDFVDAYEEWDRKLGREKPGETLDGKRGMFGYRAYQVLEASAKPSDSMPLWVKKVA